MATMRPVARHHLLLLGLLLPLMAVAADGDVDVLPAGLSPANIAAVHEICGQTDYLPICLEAARSYAGLYPEINADTMLAMQARLAVSRVEAAKAAATQLMLSIPPSDKLMRDTLDICLKMYDDVLSDLDRGLKAAEANDAGTANTSLSAIISDLSVCNDGYDEMNADNPLIKKNVVLRKMASNALAIFQSKH